jgi:hypothetical protein
MTLGRLALGAFLVCAGLAYLGVGMPAVVLGVAALIAGICVLLANDVIIGGPRG